MEALIVAYAFSWYAYGILALVWWIIKMVEGIESILEEAV